MNKPYKPKVGDKVQFSFGSVFKEAYAGYYLDRPMSQHFYKALGKDHYEGTIVDIKRSTLLGLKKLHKPIYSVQLSLADEVVFRTEEVAPIREDSSVEVYKWCASNIHFLDEMEAKRCKRHLTSKGLGPVTLHKETDDTYFLSGGEYTKAPEEVEKYISLYTDKPFRFKTVYVDNNGYFNGTCGEYSANGYTSYFNLSDFFES